MDNCRFLGPGTKLNERLSRGDIPINPLDQAALEHDIFYTQFKDKRLRHLADKILEKKAFKRVTAKDAKLSERGVALLTAGAMHLKRKLGMGLPSCPRRKKSRKPKKTRKGLKQCQSCKVGRGLKQKQVRSKIRKTGKGLAFNTLVKSARHSIKNLKKRGSLETIVGKALDVARREVKKKKFKTL